jgi:hypothetical protein
MATIFNLRRPLSCQNNYKNVNVALYNILFVSVIGSHLQSYSSILLMPAVVMLSMAMLT